MRFDPRSTKHPDEPYVSSPDWAIQKNNFLINKQEVKACNAKMNGRFHWPKREIPPDMEITDGSIR